MLLGMTTETFTLFFSFLGFGAMASVVGLVGLTLASRVGGSTSARRWLGELAPFGVAFAAAATVTAMAGSLYYSEIANFKPCHLCWIQRYFMYPSAILLVVALLWRRAARRLSMLSLALCVVGFGVAVFHRLEQQFPDSVGGACALDNPCSGRYVQQFGWITIPTLAAAAFAMAIGFLSLTLLTNESTDSPARS